MRKKTLLLAFICIIGLALVLSGCSGSTKAPASAPPANSSSSGAEGGPGGDGTNGQSAPASGPPAGALGSSVAASWLQPHILEVPPMLFKDPFLELLGQTDKPIPYTYEEVVKLAGHSCGATAGAWTITRKAMETLYPGEIPVRGQIKVVAPGPPDEWFVGVFGEIITYLTGAAPSSGFPGSEFGQAYNRRDLMVYPEEPSGTPPPKMVWTFERLDNGAKVGVAYDLMKVTPPATPERQEMSGKMARGEATPEEAADYVKYWNDRTISVFERADTLEGFFKVEKLN